MESHHRSEQSGANSGKKRGHKSANEELSKPQCMDSSLEGYGAGVKRHEDTLSEKLISSKPSSAAPCRHEQYQKVRLQQQKLDQQYHKKLDIWVQQSQEYELLKSQMKQHIAKGEHQDTEKCYRQIQNVEKKLHKQERLMDYSFEQLADASKQLQRMKQDSYRSRDLLSNMEIQKIQVRVEGETSEREATLRQLIQVPILERYELRTTTRRDLSSITALIMRAQKDLTECMEETRAAENRQDQFKQAALEAADNLKRKNFYQEQMRRYEEMWQRMCSDCSAITKKIAQLRAKASQMRMILIDIEE